MIHIVIGQSGSGKTTFVKSKWLKEPDELTMENPDLEITYWNTVEH
jgi:GTPase SAR1 family protein